jgi:hypothetical protein
MKTVKGYELPFSDIASEALTNFFYALRFDEVIERNRDYKFDPNLVMIMHAFERALDGAKASDRLLILLRRVRAGSPGVRAVFLKELTKLIEEAVLRADANFFRELADALEKHAARYRPKYERRFMVCQAFETLLERDEKLPTVEAVMKFINERVPHNECLERSTLDYIGKELGLKFGRATWKRQSPRQTKKTVNFLIYC